jgi:hypothetical protein
MRPKQLTDLDRNTKDIHPNENIPGEPEKGSINTRKRNTIRCSLETTNKTNIHTETIKLEVVQTLLEGQTLGTSYEE